ncbi:MAG: glycerol-3-phosphate 1-O-acyltransferase PlsY [Clostridia bacterium]|nr:glycerol-3-phosphate 1-O-acyltransferase PlsY [Clostridia bacterium]
MNTLLLTIPGEEQAQKVAWNLYSYFQQVLGGGETQRTLLLIGAVLLCIVTAYFIGSVNPAIIFSKLIYKEDIRSYGSGNAGATNTLRTYGTKMAILIFVLDLVKAAVAVLLGSLILTRGIGGAISALFVVLGHMFPIYYKFKGGKGVACTAMCILMLSPAAFLVILAVFLLIAFLTRFVSLGSIICAMLFPFLSFIFYPQNGFITLSAFCIAALVVFMHRENIKRLLQGKESKFSFKKTDKHKAEEHDNAAETQPAEEKAYGEGDFVKCSCGRLIPRSREVCVYCGEKNSAYVPKNQTQEGKKK